MRTVWRPRWGADRCVIVITCKQFFYAKKQDTMIQNKIHSSNMRVNWIHSLVI